MRYATTALILGACVLGGCNNNKDEDTTRTRTTSSTSRSSDRAMSTTSTSSITPDTRILSILHCKNQEEIQIGQLAIDRGESEAVRQYGRRLVRDHTENDAQVLATARAAGVPLMEPEQTKQMLAREKGLTNPPDHVAELRGLRGAAFDMRFSELMAQGHSELIQMVEAAQDEVTNPNVQTLIAQTLPTLHHHHEMATALPDDGMD